MYKVLIVDDEPMIRQGLQTLVDWDKLGFVIVGTAANGREAVQMHGELAPDLILIDIRMPLMDGLQAIGEIRENDKLCHILILSGYADFNYAKQAIVHGVGGYVLKPIDEDELESYVERVATLLNRQEEKRIGGERGTTLLREELLQSMAEGKAVEREADEQLRRDLFGDGLTGSRLLLAELYSREHSLTMNSVVKKRLAELIEPMGAGWTFMTEPFVALLIKDTPQLRGGTHDLQAILQEACGDRVRFTAVIGPPLKTLTELSATANELKSLLKRRFQLQGGVIYVLDTTALPSMDEEQPDIDIEQIAHRLFYMVELGNGEGVSRLMEETASRMAGAAETEQSLKGHWAQLLTIVLNKVAAANPQLSLKDDLSMVTRLYLAYHYDEMLQELRGRLLELTEKIGAADGIDVMKRITDFIDRHYSESLRLESLAELFNYNSGYLGKMFKSHTGENFNTYLDKVRIKNAIELLREGHKVHQVADLVGYANVDYFHSKFKKYKGASPSSYKNAGEEKLSLR